MSVKSNIMKGVDVTLCFVRKFWRPIVCMGVALSSLNLGLTIFVGGIWLPMLKGHQIDFNGLGSLATGIAALVASLTPFVAARTWEKLKGVHEDAAE